MSKRPQDITSVERLSRVQQVKELLIKGASRGQILQYCAENHETSDRVVDDYIQDAKIEIKENFAKSFDLEYFKANFIERLEDLYRENMDIDDFRECRNIIKDMRDLIGVDADKKTININENYNSKELTPEEIKRISKELEDEC